MKLVFGAHPGFDPDQRERHACICVDPEQLGAGGAGVSADCLRLLEPSAVTDPIDAYARPDDPADPAEYGS